MCESEGLKAEIVRLRKKLAKLAFREKQLELIVKSTGLGIWDWNVQTGKTWFNERWAEIIGYTLDELQPVSIKTWMTFAHPDDLEESNRLLQEHWAGNTDYYIFESRMRHKNGEWVWVYDQGQVIEWTHDGAPKRMIGTHLDITEKRRYLAKLDDLNAQLLALTHTDPLTNIANRRAYDERLNYEIAAAGRSGQPLSLLVIDIDDFKAYNDHYGHEKGDNALVRIAEAIQQALPRTTDFVARYGGEEFVVLLQSTGQEGAARVAKRILKNVRTKHIRHDYSTGTGEMTVSIGIATQYPEISGLFEQADRAMYCAKQSGKHRFAVYTPA